MSADNYIVLEDCYLSVDKYKVSIIIGKISSGSHRGWKWNVGDHAYVYCASIELVEKNPQGNFVLLEKSKDKYWYQTERHEHQHKFELNSFSTFFDQYDLPAFLNKNIGKALYYE